MTISYDFLTPLLKFNVLFAIALSGIASMLSADTGESRYHGPGFSLAVPAVFGEVHAKDPSVLLLLRHKQDGFPTFNIVAGAHEIDQTKSDKQLAAETISSYHKVGLVNADIQRIISGAPGPASSLTFEIQYATGGQHYLASVTLVPASGRHFVLTFLDHVVSYQEHRYLRDRLVGSFVLSLEQSAPASPISKSGTSITAVSLALAALVLLIFLIIFHRNRTLSHK